MIYERTTTAQQLSEEQAWIINSTKHKTMVVITNPCPEFSVWIRDYTHSVGVYRKHLFLYEDL